MNESYIILKYGSLFEAFDIWITTNESHLPEDLKIYFGSLTDEVIEELRDDWDFHSG